MTMHDVAIAIERARNVFQRRPGLGLSPDTPATARWERDLRVVTSHPDGQRIATDMPSTIGGGGTAFGPGWLFRAGLAACSATSIAIASAMEGIELDVLEVSAGSVSDGRAVLGVDEDDGRAVAAHYDLELSVRIAARGVPEPRLRALVEAGLRRSPVWATLARAGVLATDVEVG